MTDTEVLFNLITEGFCVVSTDINGKFDSKYYQAPLRSTQRYLSRVRFQRGKRTGSLKIDLDHFI